VIKKTKIVATIGPSSESEDTLLKLFDAGMNVARLNLSHGTLDHHKKLFDKIRALNDEIAILLDISGPKIRVGKLKEPIELKKGQKFILTKKDIVGDETKASVTYPALIDDLEIGSIIYLNDGLISLKVIEKHPDYLVTEVLVGGVLTSNKGINVPGSNISAYTPTKKDEKDILETAKWEPDFYSVSFVRRVKDLENVRKLISQVTSDNIPLISKIEHLDGLKNYDSIAKASQGIMVARGDLGVEIPLEKVPLVQKDLVRKANYMGIPVIVATQMLESMIVSPRPTRAEATDVANAILDGADAVMLSAETATGKYPIKAVQTMSKICVEAENNYYPSYERREVSSGARIPMNIGRAAVKLAKDIETEAILAMTQTGTTTAMVSTFRPHQIILGFATNKKTLRRLALQWGVQPVLFEFIPDTDDMILQAAIKAYEEGYIKRNQSFIVVAGSLLGLPASTNLIQYHTMDEILRSVEAQKEFIKAYSL